MRLLLLLCVLVYVADGRSSLAEQMADAQKQLTQFFGMGRMGSKFEAEEIPLPRFAKPQDSSEEKSDEAIEIDLDDLKPKKFGDIFGALLRTVSGAVRGEPPNFKVSLKKGDSSEELVHVESKTNVKSVQPPTYSTANKKDERILLPTIHKYATRPSDDKASEIEYETSDGVLIPPQTIGVNSPHVCIREISNRTPVQSGNCLEATVEANECYGFRDAYACLNVVRRNGTRYSTMKIFECCDHYTYKNGIQFGGCNIEYEAKNMSDVLREYNTLVESQPSEKSMTYIVSEEPGQKPLVIDGLWKTYDFLKESQQKTIEGGSIIATQKQEESGHHFLKTSINCVPLTKTNIRTIGGIAHVSKKTIQPVASSLMSLLYNDQRFSVFVSLLSNKSIDLLESSNSSLTVMAFTDATFNGLSEKIQKKILTKTGCLADVELNHILKSAPCSNEFGSNLTSLRGDIFKMENKNGSLFIGKSEIIERDMVAANGKLHVIQNILIGDEVLDWEDSLRHFNVDLADALAPLLAGNNETLTIFVPPNNSTKFTDSIALAHVLKGELGPLFVTQTINTFANSSLFAGKFPRESDVELRSPVEHVFQIGCSRLVGKRVDSCNSAIYFIDKPLPIVNHNMKTLLASRNDLSKFNQIFNKYPLDSSKIITLFVPSDDSFSPNSFRKLLSNETQMNEFVKKHTVDDGPMCPHDMQSSKDQIKVTSRMTSDGGYLHISPRDDGIYINEARIQETIVVSDGVVHILDAVIERTSPRPQSKSSESKAPSTKSPESTAVPKKKKATIRDLLPSNLFHEGSGRLIDETPLSGSADHSVVMRLDSTNFMFS